MYMRYLILVVTLHGTALKSDSTVPAEWWNTCLFPFWLHFLTKYTAIWIILCIWSMCKLRRIIHKMRNARRSFILTWSAGFFLSLHYGYNAMVGERGGSVVECRTPEREVRGSRPTVAVLCPWARHFTPRKYWLIHYSGSDGSVPTWLKNCWLGR